MVGSAISYGGLKVVAFTKVEEANGRYYATYQLERFGDYPGQCFVSWTSLDRAFGSSTLIELGPGVSKLYKFKAETRPGIYRGMLKIYFKKDGQEMTYMGTSASGPIGDN